MVDVVVDGVVDLEKESKSKSPKSLLVCLPSFLVLVTKSPNSEKGSFSLLISLRTSFETPVP